MYTLTNSKHKQELIEAKENERHAANIIVNEQKSNNQIRCAFL